MKVVVRTVDFCETRNKNVEILKKEIPQLEVVVDHEKDGYKSFLKACKILNDTGGILLEDDVLLCENFLEKIENIVQEKDTVYNFFEKPKTYFKTSKVGGSNFLWMQCVYIPPKFGEKCINLYEEFKLNKPKKWQGMATDCLIAYVLTKYKMKYWRIRPCLVQHLPFKSVIGKRPTNRQTPFFIDDLIKKGENYDNLQ